MQFQIFLIVFLSGVAFNSVNPFNFAIPLSWSLLFGFVITTFLDLKYEYACRSEAKYDLKQYIGYLIIFCMLSFLLAWKFVFDYSAGLVVGFAATKIVYMMSVGIQQ
jgi:hypothetical protein